MRNAEFDYEPDPMGRLGYGAWTPRTRRDPFGRLPEDEDEPLAELRRRWSDGERFKNDHSMFELGGSVGEDADNDRLDVAKVQIALHNEGRFDLDRSGGPTGYFSPPLDEAIRRRQADDDLTADGILLPGGETILSLKGRRTARERDSLGAPLPARPGELPIADAPPRTRGGIQLAGEDPVDALVAAGVAALWAYTRRSLLREALEAARTTTPIEGQAASQAASAAPAAAQVGANAGAEQSGTLTAGATKPPKPEIVSEGAVRAWLDAGRAGLALPMAGSRGADYPTQKALNITAKACRDVLNEMWPEYAEIIRHEYGATEDGKGGGNQTELVLKDPNQKGLRGSNRTDSSWRRTDMDRKNKDAYIHLNQGFVLKDGVTPIARERRQLVGLAMKKLAAHLINYIIKPEDGFDEEEYEKYSRKFCIDMFTKALGAPKQEPAR